MRTYAVKKFKLAVLVTIALLFGSAQAGQAALEAVGPVDATNGFPLWYNDTSGLKLELCLDPVFCAFDPVIPGNDFSELIGFGEEAFWWSAEAQLKNIGPTGKARVRLVMALEAAFLNDFPVDGDQMSVSRIRIRARGLVPNENYTVTHPFGTETLKTDKRGRIVSNKIRPDDIGCDAVPCDFSLALGKDIDPSVLTIGPFLTWDPLADAPVGFIGDPGIEHKITPGPNGAVFRIEGPGLPEGGVEQDLFSVQGKIFMEPATT